MATTASAIEWTDATWNCIRGCSMVSKGCESCYAMKQAHRFSGPGKPYFGLTEIGPNGPRWTGKVRCVDEALDQPLRWKKPLKVFVNSMSDLFHEDVPDQFIVDVFGIMALAHWHTFQVLTKRPERMRAFLAAGDHGILRQFMLLQQNGGTSTRHVFRALDIKRRSNIEWRWPLPNVWLGPSIENQPMAERRFPIACELGEAGWNVMVSMEPLLGTVTIPVRFLALRARAWVIVGGESGPRSRPFEVAWAWSILQQCKAAGVPVFIKQMGGNVLGAADAIAEGWPAGTRIALHDRRVLLGDRKGGDPLEWPEPLRVRQFPQVEVPA